jgi:predicted Zn-dependent protease
MPTYNATYTYSGNAQPATVVLLNDKAAIELTTEAGAQMIYWFYHAIAPEPNSRRVFGYTAYPPQTLEVLHVALAEALTARLHQGKKRAVQKRNLVALILLASFAAVTALVYFVLLPLAATAMARRVPVAYEEKLGAQAFAAMKQEFRINEAQSAYATAFFDALQVRSPYNIRIVVVKSDVANAFALPGGYIVIYDTLLAQMSSYPQLAALLAHEFVHIQNRHSLKSLFRQLGVSILFSALVGDAGAASSAVLSNMDRLKSLSYSRSLESEADADGLQLLAERHIDGNGFIQLFQILQHESGAQVPEWTSSHPNLDRRIRNIQQNKTFQQQHARTDTTLKMLFKKMQAAD